MCIHVCAHGMLLQVGEMVDVVDWGKWGEEWREGEVESGEKTVQEQWLLAGQVWETVGGGRSVELALQALQELSGHHPTKMVGPRRYMYVHVYLCMHVYTFVGHCYKQLRIVLCLLLHMYNRIHPILLLTARHKAPRY